MRQALSVRSTLWLTLLTVALAAPAFAAIVAEPIVGDAGPVFATPEGSPGRGQPSTPNVLTIVYDNSTAASPANFGFSSTDPAADWGDELFLTGTGILSESKFSIFNGGSAGVLLTAQVGVDFYNAVTSAFLGGYTTNINFGAGLNPGFFSTVTVTPLDPLLININTTDIIVVQSILAKTGTATKLGIASRNPPTVGASPGSMYIAAADVGGGAAGFYNVGNPPVPANPVYKLSLNPPPVGNKSSTWGQLKKLYR